MKKNWHFKYWNCPRCNQNGQIWTKKSISQYGYFKHSKWVVLRNLSLIPSITMIGEKKLGCHNTKIPLTSYHAMIFQVHILFWSFLVLWHPNFFSQIIVIDGIRLKFRSTAHLECLKYPYWDMLFFSPNLTFLVAAGAISVLKMSFFFLGSSLLYK